jgi:hypothetical protein
MTPPAGGKPLEPWPGYAKLSEEDRSERFHMKVSEARLRGDLLYAKALCVAVAATEALEGREDGLAAEARKSAQSIDKFGAALFKEAGGWTPK